MNNKYSVIISYRFVVYIHGHVFLCIAAFLTNHSSWSSALLQHQKCINIQLKTSDIMLCMKFMCVIDI